MNKDLLILYFILIFVVLYSVIYDMFDFFGLVILVLSIGIFYYLGVYNSIENMDNENKIDENLLKKNNIMSVLMLDDKWKESDIKDGSNIIVVEKIDVENDIVPLYNYILSLNDKKLNISISDSVYNVNDFTLIWNFKCDSKLMKIDTLEQMPSTKMRYNLINMRNYIKELNEMVHYDLNIDYCIELTANKNIIKYMEISFDDSTNYTNPEIYSDDTINKWRYRYHEGTKLKVFNDINDTSAGLKSIKDDFYNFMIDNIEHTFTLVRRKNDLLIFIDGIQYQSKMVNISDIIDNGAIHNGKPLKFKTFFTSTTDNHINVNSTNSFSNSSSYLNFIGLYNQSLSIESIALISSDLKELSIKYKDLSSELIQKSISEKEDLQKQLKKIKIENEDKLNANKTNNFKDSEINKLCSKSVKVSDWNDFKDIMINANKDCLTNMAKYCLDEKTNDPSCKFDRKILTTLNNIIEFNKPVAIIPDKKKVEQKKEIEQLKTVEELIQLYDSAKISQK
jgi:hypothetical protein